MGSKERERGTGGNRVLAAGVLLPKVLCDYTVQRGWGRKVSVQLLFDSWALAVGAMVRFLSQHSDFPAVAGRRPLPDKANPANQRRVAGIRRAWKGRWTLGCRRSCLSMDRGGSGSYSSVATQTGRDAVSYARSARQSHRRGSGCNRGEGRRVRRCSHGQVGLFRKDRRRFPEALRDEVVPNQQQQLLLRKSDPGLGHHVGLLQARQRDVGADEQGLPRDALDELGRVLAELDVLAALVLQHRLLHQLLDLAAAEQGQLADDLPDGAAARQPHQGFAGQGPDLIRVSDRHLHRQQ